jgi:SAM-dependent methyltransferase
MTPADFFRPGSPFLKHPLLTPERSAGEVDFLASGLELAPGARVLDVGCGFGRHCLELARRGYQVVGIDPSTAMIQAARLRAAQAGLGIDFRQTGGEALEAEAEFDAAVCLFTTLGQMCGRGDNSLLVERVYRALRPGGRLAVEVPQRDAAVAQLKPRERVAGPRRYARITRRFEPGRNVMTEIYEVIAPPDVQRYVLRYRLYSREELIDLLGQAGFTLLAAYGGYDATPLGPHSATMLMIASK